MGQDLMNHSNNSSNAYGSMTSGDYQGWHMGLDFQVPFGWRKERAAVRHAELNLIKYRVLLQEQELALDHSLGDAIREMARFYNQAEIAFNTRRAAQEEVMGTEESYDRGNTTLDQVLDAQRRLAEAESSYFNSIVNYNLSITKLHYLKGSLLEFNNVALAEGPWPGKAQFDAIRQARKRDAGHYINYGYTRPGVISRGVYQQFQNPQQAAAPNYQMPVPGMEQVIYNDQAFIYEGGAMPYQGTTYPQGQIYQYETLPGSVNPQPNYGTPAGQYQQPYQVMPVQYQTNYSGNTSGSNSSFATATPAVQQPVAYSYSVNYPAQTNPMATSRSTGYR
jgi:hypothetical protein